MLLNNLIEKKKERIKSLAVLIDPDKINSASELIELINYSNETMVDYLLVGGSLITKNHLKEIIASIKYNCDIPIIIFPGNNSQIADNADGILFLSLISGRNAEFLIGQQVVAAPILKRTKLEIISTGYMLVGDPNSGVSYMSGTTPIPYNQATIASATAMAGEMLGNKLIYLDAGSGAENPVQPDMIKSVAKSVDLPVIVGGGINDLAKVSQAINAGADLVVIGNKIEEQPEFLLEVSGFIKSWNESLQIH